MSTRTELRAFLRGFRFASAGVLHCIRTQRNFRFHMGAAAGVAWMGLVCHVSRVEGAVLAICIGGVMMAECINTAIEYAVDECVGEKRTELAMYAKDCAAGGVLVFSCAAAAVGVLEFFGYERRRMMIDYFSESPVRLVLGAAFLALWFLWVFVCFRKADDRRKG